MPIFIYLFIFKRNRLKKRDFFYLLIFGGYIWAVFDVTGIGTLSNIVYAPKGGVESFWIQLKEGLSIHPWQVIFLGYLGQCFLYFPFWFVQHF